MSALWVGLQQIRSSEDPYEDPWSCKAVPVFDLQPRLRNGGRAHRPHAGTQTAESAGQKAEALSEVPGKLSARSGARRSAQIDRDLFAANAATRNLAESAQRPNQRSK